LPYESGTDGATHVRERVRNLIQSAIGLETHADDTRLDLLGAFRWGVWPSPFGEESGRCPLEDRVAAVVVGGARLAAEGGGACPFGEAAELPEGEHADLLLDALCRGDGDGLADTVCEHESTLLDLHVEVESERHGHGLPRGGVGVPERGR
jgi:hypothetical protein